MKNNRSVGQGIKEARVRHFGWHTHFVLSRTHCATWTWLHARPLAIKIFFFFFPTRPQMVRFGPKQSKIGSNLGRNTYKKNVNFKINFYLVVVSNFWYCILIYEYHVMVMYLLYYLLLLVNWYIYIYIYIYHYMKKVFSFQQYIENKNKNIFNN